MFNVSRKTDGNQRGAIVYQTVASNIKNEGGGKFCWLLRSTFHPGPPKQRGEFLGGAKLAKKY